MTRLHETISRALFDLGEPSDIDLGSIDRKPEAALDEAWRKQLLERLAREAGLHKRMLLGIVLACFALFVAGISLLLYGGGGPSTVRLLVSGALLGSMLAALQLARRTLVDKAGYDILLTVVGALPPDQVGIVLRSLYYMHKTKE